MVVVDPSLEIVKELMQALCGCRDSEVKRQIWLDSIANLIEMGEMFALIAGFTYNSNVVSVRINYT